MNLIIGEKIFVIDENLQGTLIAFDDASVTIECPDGFEYRFKKSQVYRLNESGKVEKEIAKPLVNIPIKVKNVSIEKAPRYFKPSHVSISRNNPSVDLHLEKLLPAAYHSISTYEALDYQLSVVHAAIAEAFRQRIKEFTLIHGIGKGVLRNEILRVIRDHYSDVEAVDADYIRYRGGATKLIIHRFNRRD